MPFDGNYDETAELVYGRLLIGRERVIRGWRPYVKKRDRRWWHPPANAICAATALGVDWIAIAAVKQLEAALGVTKGADLFRWNDEPGRVKADIVQLYDRALIGCRHDL